MTKDEALKLALDALSPDPYRSEWIVALDMDKAITAIKEALMSGTDGAQPEQEPYWERVARIKEEMLRVSYEENKLLKEALEKPEPVKIAHKHEWFRTGEMKVGQMRCISCGTWGQEEMPQRTWVGLTDEDDIDWEDGGNLKDLVKAIEAKLKEKNT